MTSDGAQPRQHASDLQLKFIGFLLAVSLSILGWGFNNWSNAVESGMAEVMQKLNMMDRRYELQQERHYELAKELRIIQERQNQLRQQMERHEEKALHGGNR